MFHHQQYRGSLPGDAHADVVGERYDGHDGGEELGPHAGVAVAAVHVAQHQGAQHQWEDVCAHLRTAASETVNTETR